jgi:type IV pilus assembly protein PilQ
MYEGNPRIILDVARDRKFDVMTVGSSVVLAFRGVYKIKESAPEAPKAGAAPEPREEAAAPSATKEATAAKEAEGADADGLKRVKPKYTGRIISLDFQDADIIPIYRFIGEVANMNVVIHPDVKGKITLKLMNVPWDQSLDIVLRLSGHDKSMEGNIMTIAPTNVFTAMKEEATRLKVASAKAADLVQGTVHLDFIEASEFATKLKDSKVLSDRGTARIDARTNTLIINDSEEVFRRIVNDDKPYWDTPEHGKLQVMIEARIVEVSTKFSRSLGIRWGGNATQDNISFIDDASTYDFSVNTPILGAGPLADLGAGGGVLSLGYTETFTANMSLEALESLGQSRNLANPKVLTMDGQAAKIEQGTEIPYSTTSSEGTKTEFKSAALSLNVTPEVQPNNIIKLKVSAKNDSPTRIEGADAPAVSTQSIDTSALIKDSETLVLGGIYKLIENDSESGLPWLGKIPILGWLFKTKGVTKDQTELLIFITPKIIGRTL